MVAALENLETAATVPPAGTSAGDNDTAAAYHGATLTCQGSPNFNTYALGCTGGTHFKYLVAGGDQSTYFMAGEAYDAHTRDLRPHEFLDSTGTTKSSGIQTVSTYWLDVLESQDYKWRKPILACRQVRWLHVADIGVEHLRGQHANQQRGRRAIDRGTS